MLKRGQSRQEWRRLLNEPGVTGPLEHEEGYEIFVAEKHEEVALGGQGVELHFEAAGYRWRKGGWLRLGAPDERDKGQARGCDTLELELRKRQAGGGENWWQVWPHLPRDEDGNVITDAHGQLVARSELPPLNLDGVRLVWPADTPIEILAATWFEFNQRIREANRGAWEQRQQKLRELEELTATTTAIAAAGREAVAQQRGVADLLPGPTAPSLSLSR